MSTSALTGIGTEFHRWNGSSWDKIAEITSIKGPGMKRDTIDVTSLDSTAGYKEFITGLRDAGTISLAMNFTRAGLTLMKGDFESEDLQYYEIIIDDAVLTSLEFAGLVTELPLSIAATAAISMDVTIQISGVVTVNSGVNSGSPN
jgi:predicted secreted protein